MFKKKIIFLQRGFLTFFQRGVGESSGWWSRSLKKTLDTIIEREGEGLCWEKIIFTLIRNDLY